MKSFLLGHDATTGCEVRFPSKAFATHLHLIGGTGKGKTTAIHTMLHSLLNDPLERCCFFMIDRLGNFSQELLLWLSSRFCTESVRRRLVYIQPSREDVVPTFNPLSFQTDGECFYRVERTTEIILRAWESQDIQQMPRLARWTFNAFMAAAKLRLTVADCNHFVMPGSPYHQPLLNLLPDRLKQEWEEITSSRGQEATRILDSSRNRLKPYFDSDILRRIFGGSRSRLDVLRLMREGRIVVIDLSPRNRLSMQSANTIGALIINEVLATARSLPREIRYPTYLLLDEFQNFVGPDIEAALPEVRQLGLRMILSHQSFSQLKHGDQDLTSMIFQAQSRMIFGVQGEDADLLAHEVASIKYDARRVKDELWSRRQLNAGYRKEMLSGFSEGHSDQTTRGRSSGENDGDSRGESKRKFTVQEPLISQSNQKSKSSGRSESESNSSTYTKSGHETLVPEYEDFRELSSRTYFTFDEQKQEWAREIRKLKTGQAILRLVDDPKLYCVNVKRSAPGFLDFDTQTLARKIPAVLERMDQMIEENFRSDFFVAAADVDREAKLRLEEVLRPKITVGGLATENAVETDFGI